MYRKTFVKVDTNILQDNIKKITAAYNDYKYYIGVVKGNAYGHGDYIVNDLIKAGINYLAVSSLEEALSIRKYNKKIPILCLEPIDISNILIAEENNITITVESLKYVQELLQVIKLKKINIHIKIDSGMNRLGFKNIDDLTATINLINKHSPIYLEGIYTHFATSGANDKYYDEQIAKFKELTKNIDLSKIPIVHINRSITLTRHKKLPFETGTRLGIIMYGFDSNIEKPTGLSKLKSDIMHKIKKISPIVMSNGINLNPAFSLYTTIISLRKVKRGEFVGYGGNYIAKEDMTIATLPIGYLDGMNARWESVYINNKKYKIVGDVCMDMTLVKVDDSVKINDSVEIFGNNISIKEVASKINSNAYHIITGITNRVPRVYNNKIEIKY